MEFKPGNVVKLKDGYIVIIVKHRTVTTFNSDSSYKVVDWVSFSHSGTSGSTGVDTSKKKEVCGECNSHYEQRDPECDNCKGDGTYMAIRHGMDEAVLLSGSVKDYILEKLTVNFEF